MSNDRKGAIRYAARVGAFAIVLIIVVHGLRRGWDDISTLDYWIDKAVAFVAITVVLALFAPRRRPAGKP